jgi:dephospho-CoA kinase
MLIALFGPPGAGKDTVAKRLVEQHGFVRVAFADKVRELAYEVITPQGQQLVDTIGWDTLKREQYWARAVLELVGDGARKVFGPEFWISAIRDPVIHILRHGGNVVITDLRKESEKQFVDGLDLHIFGGSKLWHITRPGFEKRPFDEWQPEWANLTIANDDTVETLNQRVDRAIAEI